MQFQNAVITPSGIAIFSAANTNKPIKFTRFLFTDSVTRLTGQEAELPPNTWGNGSVDAVLGQDELQQFVIFASASNAEDYGYARGYGIYAEQEGVEYLVAVANCLGDPTYVSQMSGGYTRFHLALTIKYSVNSNVLTVAPNIGGLISREEFEMWTERVVTTHSPSGAPHGENQTIYGTKTFHDNVTIYSPVQVGTILNPTQMMLFCDNVGLMGSLIPMGHPSMPENLGLEQIPWDNIYCDVLHAGTIKGVFRELRIKSSALRYMELSTATITPSIVVSTPPQPFELASYIANDGYGSYQRLKSGNYWDSLALNLCINQDWWLDSTHIKVTFAEKKSNGRVECNTWDVPLKFAASITDQSNNQIYFHVEFECNGMDYLTTVSNDTYSITIQIYDVG